MSIAVVGTGVIGPRHADSIVKCQSAILTCFVDPAPHGFEIAKRFDVTLYRSVEDMLQQGCKPDAALVCTPNKTHVDVATLLLSAGIHVLVEKPISTTIASGHELLHAARQSNKVLAVGHHRRFNPYITATKKVLDDGRIGRPIAVSGLWALCKPQSYFDAPTEWRAKADDGGAILINMIHEIDIMHFLFGPIVKVHAEKTIPTRDHDAEEGAAILLRFESGLVGTFILSDSTPSVHNFEGGTGENPIIPKTGQDFYRIFGTEGTLSVGDMKISKHPSHVEKSWSHEIVESKVEIGQEVPFDEQILQFVRAVQGLEQPRCSGIDGLRALIVCDAIKQALQRDGGVIDIEIDL